MMRGEGVLEKGDWASILLLDVHFGLVRRRPGPANRLLVLIAGVVVVVIATVVIVALVLRHVDLVKNNADQIAADFLDELLGADVHGLRIAPILNDLKGHIDFAGQNRS